MTGLARASLHGAARRRGPPALRGLPLAAIAPRVRRRGRAAERTRSRTGGCTTAPPSPRSHGSASPFAPRAHRPPDLARRPPIRSPAARGRPGRGSQSRTRGLRPCADAGHARHAGDHDDRENFPPRDEGGGARAHRPRGVPAAGDGGREAGSRPVAVAAARRSGAAGGRGAPAGDRGDPPGLRGAPGGARETTRRALRRGRSGGGTRSRAGEAPATSPRPPRRRSRRPRRRRRHRADAGTCPGGEQPECVRQGVQSRHGGHRQHARRGRQEPRRRLARPAARRSRGLLPGRRRSVRARRLLHLVRAGRRRGRGRLHHVHVAARRAAGEGRARSRASSAR